MAVDVRQTLDEPDLVGWVVEVFGQGSGPCPPASVAAAMRTALPVTKVWREAVVGPPSGVRSVSITRTRHAVGRGLEFFGHDHLDHGDEALA